MSNESYPLDPEHGVAMVKSPSNYLQSHFADSCGGSDSLGHSEVWRSDWQVQWSVKGTLAEDDTIDCGC